MITDKKRKIYTAISIVVLIALVGFITWIVLVEFKKFGNTPEQFREFIESFGWAARFVALGVQMLQVVVALIPGEAVEIGLGYAFGAFEGTLICYAGVILASSAVFLLVRKFGVKLLEVFFPVEKINDLKWINNEKKLMYTIFILFLIPGTPKDVLTYFVGLTKIKLGEFLVISSLARFPSVISSTAGGALASSENYFGAVIVFAVTALISVCGLIIYNKLLKRKENKNEKEN